MIDRLAPGPIWLECYDENGERYLAPGWLSHRDVDGRPLTCLDELTPEEARWAGFKDPGIR
jgi:hypothetical protein